MVHSPPLVRLSSGGLYCEAGDFYIDPSRRVSRAIITHAHSDHARPGSKAYLCANSGVGVLTERVGAKAPIEGLAYGEKRRIGEVEISLHPAGHVLGSAQVRLDLREQVWVVTGDFKREADPSCEDFELVTCETLVTECTFGFPIYRWPPAKGVFEEINSWWRSNRELGRTSVLFAYGLGKAQRLLAGVDPEIGPIGIGGAAARFLPHYAREGFLPTAARLYDSKEVEVLKGKGLVIGPPSGMGSTWWGGLGPVSTAFASGWMRLRRARRRRAFDRGFILSDHADWPALVRTIGETGARRVGVMHGSSSALVRWLKENGWEAFEMNGAG